MIGYDVTTTVHTYEQVDELKKQYPLATVIFDDGDKLRVYLDTVFYDSNIPQDTIRRSLIEHDGFPIPCYVNVNK